MHDIMLSRRPASTQSGFSLIEVMVSVLILVFGLLALAGFQLRAQSAEMESYQRAQALALMQDMVARVDANNANAANYVSTTVWGTGDTTYASTDCTTLAVGTPQRDWCEWTQALQGSAELSSSSVKIGAMVGARGCISQIQLADPTAGVCAPAIYEIAVAWQGLSATAAPVNTCAQGLYGANDALRRVISMRVTVGLPACS